MVALPTVTDICTATGKRILIVGVVTPGLLLALECHRLGWEPCVLERRESSQMVGDFIVIGPSAVKIFRHWPWLQAEFNQKAYSCHAIYHRHTSEHILGPVPLKTTTGKPMLRHNLQQMLEDAVARLNIPVKYGHKVDSYFETDDEGGVVLADGRRLTGDVVAACDGVQSRLWTVISKIKKEPINSGHAVYRTAVPADKLFAADPNLRERFGCLPSEPYLRWFSGPDTRAIVFSDGETQCWSIHHPANSNTSSESLSANLDATTVETQMLEQNKEWDPLLLSLVRNTAGHSINDWLLLLRDPDPQSNAATCSPFPPNLGEWGGPGNGRRRKLGGSIALGDRPLGLHQRVPQAYNQIRFPRTSCAQLMGMVHRQVHHKTDWDFIRKHPEILAETGPGKWIAQHDPEVFMKENFEACLSSVRQNAIFEPKDTPPGYQVKPWTCEEVFAREKVEDMLHLEGDWK